MALAGIDSTTLILMFYGSGWLVVLFFPKERLVALLRVATVLSAALLPFQMFMEAGAPRLWVFLAFHLLNGVCTSIGFYIFSFWLNNVERLSALIVIQVYYAVIPYMLWDITAVAGFMKTFGTSLVAVALLVSVFVFRETRPANKANRVSFMHSGDANAVDSGITNESVSLGPGRMDRSGKGSAVPLVLAIEMTYCVSMFMTMYLEYDIDLVIGYIYGLGMLVSVILIVVIQLLFNKSAFHSWNLFLVFTILGLAGLLIDNTYLINGGSLFYGIGDGFGYVTLLYLLAGTVKRSESFRMFRLACLVNFFEYVPLVYGTDVLFARLELPNQYIAFAIVLVLVCICVSFSPALQKKLFVTDWVDDFHMVDMGKYEELAIVEEVEEKENLGLTPREKQIFTLLLTELTPKQIAAELKISRGTVNFHTTNLYRKLDIQSRTELFAKFSGTA
jgi:DNA-binding CsgD family transcriptional regulator